MNFIVEYKDSQQYVVPKIKNRWQAAFVKFGYFDSGTSFQNSIMEEALCAICNAWSSFISNYSNSPAAFLVRIISENRNPSLVASQINGFTKYANVDLKLFKSLNLLLKFACNFFNFSLYSSNVSSLILITFAFTYGKWLNILFSISYTNSRSLTSKLNIVCDKAKVFANLLTHL